MLKLRKRSRRLLQSERSSKLSLCVIGLSCLCAITIPLCALLGYFLILESAEWLPMKEHAQQFFMFFIGNHLIGVGGVAFVFMVRCKVRWIFMACAFLAVMFAIFLFVWMPLWLRMQDLYFYGGAIIVAVTSFFCILTFALALTNVRTDQH
jgi:hypothetical protein